MEMQYLQNIGSLLFSSKACRNYLSLEIVGGNANMQIKDKIFVVGIFGDTPCLRLI